MTSYILFGGRFHDCPILLGVYTSLEKCEKAQSEHEKTLGRFYYYTIERRNIDDAAIEPWNYKDNEEW